MKQQRAGGEEKEGGRIKGRETFGARGHMRRTATPGAELNRFASSISRDACWLSLLLALVKMSFLRLAFRNVARPRLAFSAAAIPSTRSRILQSASYSAAAGLDKEQITARVLDVLKGFEKVKQDKVRIPSTLKAVSTRSWSAIAHPAGGFRRGPWPRQSRCR